MVRIELAYDITVYISNFDLLLNNPSNTLQRLSHYTSHEARSKDRVPLSDIYTNAHE